jgi:hypothetical protein
MPSYWDQFPDFDHDPNAPIKEEFQRLARLKGWVGNAPEIQKMFRKEWGECFLSEFDKYYGCDASSLAGWQLLCEEVGLKDIPDSVRGCRSVSWFLHDGFKLGRGICLLNVSTWNRL